MGLCSCLCLHATNELDSFSVDGIFLRWFFSVFLSRIRFRLVAFCVCIFFFALLFALVLLGVSCRVSNSNALHMHKFAENFSLHLFLPQKLSSNQLRAKERERDTENGKTNTQNVYA